MNRRIPNGTYGGVGGRRLIIRSLLKLCGIVWIRLVFTRSPRAAAYLPQTSSGGPAHPDVPAGALCEGWELVEGFLGAVSEEIYCLLPDLLLVQALHLDVFLSLVNSMQQWNELLPTIHISFFSAHYLIAGIYYVR